METEKKRLALLDTLRGITLVSMMGYHGLWNLIAEGLVHWDWYLGRPGYLWQQSICWTFILLSGFCHSLGRNPLKRGLTVFGGGLLVTAVTCLLLPQQRIVLGILTFMGSSMLLMIPLRRVFEKIPPALGGAGSFALFALCRFLQFGTHGYARGITAWLPEALRQSCAAAWLGFPGDLFWSTDYFPMLPWFFLFVTGWFLYRLWNAHPRWREPLTGRQVPVLTWLGRHSLLVYLLHQPILWGAVQVFLLLKG